MFCWRARSLLSAYVDRELPPGRARAVARHLERCPGCAARERELRRVWDVLAELPPPEDGADDLWPGIERRLADDARPPALDERFRWWVPAAVAISALLGVAGGTWFALRFAAPSPRAAETVRAVATDDSFAEAFGEGPAEAVMRGLFAATPAPPARRSAAGEDAR
ncbi:MAG: hypothetical protein GYA57_05195 [Myxococcales bacterium]|nr:hypothetical protein [Myxococcales bacterium]